MLNWIALMFSSVCFVGFIPGWLWRPWRDKGGGTMGSLVGLVLQVLCLRDTQGWLGQVDIIGGSMLLGMMTVARAEAFMLGNWGPGRGKGGKLVVKDRNQTCVDELLGMGLTGVPIYFLAHRTVASDLVLPCVGFVLFRLFDGCKPGPVKWAEDKFPGVLGIMADDAVAGIMAALSLSILVGYLNVFG